MFPSSNSHTHQLMSSPAMSTLAIPSVCVQSCNVHPCHTVRLCPVLQCPVLQFQHPRTVLHSRKWTMQWRRYIRARQVKWLAEKLPLRLAPWLQPWLTKISINFINYLQHMYSNSGMTRWSRTTQGTHTGLVLRSFGSSQLVTCLTTLLTWKWPGCLDVLAPALEPGNF